MKTMLRANLMNALLVTTVALSPVTTHCSDAFSATAATLPSVAINNPVAGSLSKKGLLQSACDSVRSFISNDLVKAAAVAGVVISLPFIYSAYLDYCESQKSNALLISKGEELRLQAQSFLNDFATIAASNTSDTLESAINTVVNHYYCCKEYPHLTYVNVLSNSLSDINREVRVIKRRIESFETGTPATTEEYATLASLATELSFASERLTAFYKILLTSKAFQKQAAAQQIENSISI